MLLYRKKLSPKRISRYLNTSILGREIIHFKICGSTNAEAKQRHLTQGALVIADKQTLGRGRLGNAWESNKGGIYMSVVLPANDNTAITTLLVAVAVRRALGIGEIKWPNDIVIDRKKVCGILCEKTVHGIVCGIGVNINNRVSHDIPATALPRRDISRTIAEILNELEPLLNCQFTDLREEYLASCINIGKHVCAVSANNKLEGIATDVTPAGELIIKTDTGEVTVTSGEVSIKGIYK